MTDPENGTPPNGGVQSVGGDEARQTTSAKPHPDWDIGIPISEHAPNFAPNHSPQFASGSRAPFWARQHIESHAAKAMLPDEYGIATQADFAAAEARIVTMKAALQFYARRGNWVPDIGQRAPRYLDEGDIARQVLAEIGA